jgi:hypothetical protein
VCWQLSGSVTGLPGVTLEANDGVLILLNYGALPYRLTLLYVAEFALMMCFVYSPYALAEVPGLFCQLKFRITVENFEFKINSRSTTSVSDPWHFGIRIRIRGSMPLTNGSGSVSCYFCHWPLRRQQKTNFLKVFLLFTFWRYFYIIFQR